MDPSRRILSVAGLIALGLITSACGKKPSEEECEKFADHFVELLEKSREKPDARIRKLAQNQRQQLVDACVEDGTKDEIDCVLGQTSLADVEANCK